MNQYFKYILFSLLGLITAVLLIISIWIAKQLITDPLDYIDQPINELHLLSDSSFFADFLPEGRAYHSMTLHNIEQGDISILVSTPLDIPDEGLPVIIILGGLEIGKYTLSYIPDPGENIIIVYQYPYHPEYWYRSSALEEIPTIRNSVLSVPAQVISIINWILKQKWADNNKISVTGYSFGALFVPGIYRLAAQYKFPLNFGIIAYGGTDIYLLLKTNMTNISQPFRSIISRLAAVSIRGIEPAFHAPYLNAEFLVINGARDHQIPEESWQKLHQLIPDPKTIVILEEGHMHPRKADLTRQLVKLSHAWLIEKGMANR